MSVLGKRTREVCFSNLPKCCLKIIQFLTTMDEHKLKMDPVFHEIRALKEPIYGGLEAFSGLICARASIEGETWSDSRGFGSTEDYDTHIQETIYDQRMARYPEWVPCNPCGLGAAPSGSESDSE